MVHVGSYSRYVALADPSQAMPDLVNYPHHHAWQKAVECLYYSHTLRIAHQMVGQSIDAVLEDS